MMFIANADSVLPGPLNAELQSMHLVIHLLDDTRLYTCALGEP